MPAWITTARVRQGQPEVVFGLGKSPSQVVEIARRIADRGHALLVTRATPEMGSAVSTNLTGCRYDAVSRTIVRPATDPDGPGAQPGAKPGPVLVCCAGTSDLPVAEEAAVCGEALGTGCRAPLRRRGGRDPPPARRTEPPRGRARPDRRGRDGRRPAERRRRPDRRPGHRGAHQRGLRRQLRRPGGAPGDAEQLRLGHRGHEHRQRVRRRGPGRPNPPTGRPNRRHWQLAQAKPGRVVL